MCSSFFTTGEIAKLLFCVLPGALCEAEGMQDFMDEDFSLDVIENPNSACSV